MLELAGRCAVITGGASGIGRGMARALTDAGVNVVVADIDEVAAAVVAKDLVDRGSGTQSIAVGVDVASRESVHALANAAFGHFGEVHILCNNAGVILRPFRSVADISYEDWKFIVDVNLWGVIHGFLAFLPRMREQTGEKHLVTTSSEAPLMAVRGQVAYAATKAAVLTMSECAAKELAPEGFGVTILAPGAVATSIGTTERLRPAAERSESRHVPVYDSPDVAHYLADRGLYQDPDDVGVLVREAIRANQLFLLTHPTPAEVGARMESLLAGPGIVE